MSFEKPTPPKTEDSKDRASLGKVFSRREVVGSLGIASVLGGLATAEYLKKDKKNKEVTKEEE